MIKWLLDDYTVRTRKVIGCLKSLMVPHREMVLAALRGVHLRERTDFCRVPWALRK